LNFLNNFIISFNKEGGGYMIEKKSKTHSKTIKIFNIIIAILALVVLILDRVGPLRDKMDAVGFIIFTVICLVMIVINRQYKNKVIIGIIFYLFGLSCYFYM
jgi:uncharacterized membrane protein